MSKDNTIFALCSLFCLVACTAKETDDKFYNTEDKIQVVDCLDRKVSFNEPVKTIATSQGGAVDTYFHALQVSDRIVATNGHHKLDKMFFNPDNMPQVGKWSLDKEALAKVKPDLYIGGINADDLRAANKIGVKAYGMAYNTFEYIEYNLKTLGTLFGVEERATFVVNYLKGLLDIVDERTKDLKEEDRPTAIMLSTAPGEISSKVDTMAETMMKRAGCVSVVPETYTKMPDKANVGIEQILKWNPDVIFFQDLDCELNSKILYSSDVWKNANAVTKHSVFDIPSSLDSWTKSDPACYLGILYMCKQVYPSLFEDIDIKERTIDFYKTIYGLDLTEEQIGFEVND